MQKDEETEVKENEKAEDTQGISEGDASAVTDDGLEENGETKEGVEPEKSKKMLFIIIGVVAFLFIIIGVFFLTPVSDMLLGEDDPNADKRETEELQAKAVTYLPIPDLTINLKKTRGRSRTLTASFVLALENEDVRKNVNHFIPMVQDQFNTFLREMNVSDLEGISGIERVSQEMLIRINRVVAPFRVKDVLVQKFYIR